MAEDQHAKFMRRAIELSIENVRSGRGGPFAAVVVRDGKIIAEGTNRVTSTNDPTAHAEVVAIREACKALGTFQLIACDFYTSCEPCPMCLGAIYWARPARIFYAGTAHDAASAGFDDSFIYKELLLPHNQRTIPMTQMLREEALASFRAWMEKPDKTPY
jgi:tRNA(Arg) A34 adenosine deaminase TadA